jgi:hypothetical protein
MGGGVEAIPGQDAGKRDQSRVSRAQRRSLPCESYMRKIEVCLPTEFLESLQSELTAAGILVQNGLRLPCGSFRTDLPLNEKEYKGVRTTRSKLELIISNRLAPRATEIITDFLRSRNWNSSFNFFIISEVEACYQFETAYFP